MVWLRSVLQVLSVGSLIVGTSLSIKKNKLCWLFYQLGAICRLVNYMDVGLHIEMLVQVWFTYMNVKGFRAWRKR